MMAVSGSSSCLSDAESTLSSEISSSSDFSDDESVSELLTGMEVRPYQFEPEASPDGRSPEDSPVSAPITEGPDERSDDRIGNVDWCTCGHCSAMSTQRESICCKEIDKMRDLLAGLILDSRPPCITEHPDFSNVCLCRAVLTVSMHGHRYHYGSSDIPMDENRKFRYLAYRQLTWWGWEYLGRHRRVVLPSCAVSRIRLDFPSADHEYTGHQHPPATP